MSTPIINDTTDVADRVFKEILEDIEKLPQRIADARTIEVFEKTSAAERAGTVKGLRWAASCLAANPELARAFREVADGVAAGKELPPRV